MLECISLAKKVTEMSENFLVFAKIVSLGYSDRGGMDRALVLDMGHGVEALFGLGEPDCKKLVALLQSRLCAYPQLNENNLSGQVVIAKYNPANNRVTNVMAITGKGWYYEPTPQNTWLGEMLSHFKK